MSHNLSAGGNSSPDWPYGAQRGGGGNRQHGPRSHVASQGQHQPQHQSNHRHQHPQHFRQGNQGVQQNRNGGPRQRRGHGGGGHGGGGHAQHPPRDRKAMKQLRRNNQLQKIAEKSAGEDRFYRQCILRWEQNIGRNSVARQSIPENQLFGQQRSGAAGINFDVYDKIEVDRSGKDSKNIPTMEAFADLYDRFPPFLSRNVEKMGYVKPTPIQSHAVPISLAGRDLMCCAQTGSGKTAAFLLPMVSSLHAQFSGAVSGKSAPPQQLQNLRPRHHQFVDRFQVAPVALVLAPTRELAIQIEIEAQKLCNRSGLWPSCVFGGVKASQQLAELARGADIIVATPGRLQDFVNRGLVSLARIRFLVLDEADRMLDMGFEPQIRRLVEGSSMPPCPSPQNHRPQADYRQTLMFSATFPKAMQELAGKFLSPDYVWVGVGRVGSTVTQIEQRLVLSTSNKHDKLQLLWEALKSRPGMRTIVFCRRKSIANWITKKLCRSDQPVRASEIHGDRTQAQRMEALRDFRTGQCTVLVATDVAARGLDVQGVEHVINFDLATTDDEFDSYVHRIGRTGRLGRMGLSTSFYVPGMEPSQGCCGRIVKKLLHLLKESGQDIPKWFLQLPELSGKGGQYSHPSNAQQRDHRAGQQRNRIQHKPHQKHSQNRNQASQQQHQKPPRNFQQHAHPAQQQQQQYFPQQHHGHQQQHQAHQAHPAQYFGQQHHVAHREGVRQGGRNRGGHRGRQSHRAPAGGYYGAPNHGQYGGEPGHAQQQAYGTPVIRVQVPMVAPQQHPGVSAGPRH